MKKTKKDVYKELLRNITKTKSISKSTRNILSEKGGRNIINRLKVNGYVKFNYTQERFILVNLTSKGKELLNKLNDFSYTFKERELFK